MSAFSLFAVLAWIESEGRWSVVSSGFATYADASRWAAQFQTPSMPACVRRQPVVLPAAPVAA